MTQMEAPRKITAQCGHDFCQTCIMRILRVNSQTPRCPICRTLFAEFNTRNIAITDILLTRYCERPVPGSQDILQQQRQPMLNEVPLHRWLKTLSTVVLVIICVIVVTEIERLVNFVLLHATVSYNNQLPHSGEPKETLLVR
jgi:hypothetical protein